MAPGGVREVSKMPRGGLVKFILKITFSTSIHHNTLCGLDDISISTRCPCAAMPLYYLPLNLNHGLLGWQPALHMASARLRQATAMLAYSAFITGALHSAAARS